MSGAIGWVDHCKDDINGAPTLDDTGTPLSSLAFDPAYPARNCLTPDVSRVTRIDYDTGFLLSEFFINCELSVSNDVPVRIIAALNVRLPADLLDVIARVKNTAGSVIESGATYFKSPTPNLTPIPGTLDRYDLFWILSEEHLCSDVDIKFRVSTNTDVDYIEIGRMWAGPAVVFPCGVGYEWGLSGVDPSRIYRSEGGGYAAYQYPTRKVLSVTNNGLTYEQALGGVDQTTGNQIASLREIFLGAGTSSPVVLISSDQTQHEAQAGSVYGLITSFPSLDHAGKRYYGTNLRIEQLR